MLNYVQLNGVQKKTEKEINQYINNKIINKNKVLLVLGLIDNDTMLGFISLFKYDGDERKDLTPWYVTMYIKEKYRNKGYSKLLNKELLKETKKLGYNKIYLKTNLENYYEKYGAKYIEKLNNGEKLYYIEIK